MHRAGTGGGCCSVRTILRRAKTLLPSTGGVPSRRFYFRPLLERVVGLGSGSGGADVAGAQHKHTLRKDLLPRNGFLERFIFGALDVLWVLTR